jgi:hypothetical protein
MNWREKLIEDYSKIIADNQGVLDGLKSGTQGYFAMNADGSRTDLGPKTIEEYERRIIELQSVIDRARAGLDPA